MNSKKISLVFLTRKTVGGIKAHILDLVRSLDKEKYEISVLGPIDKDFINKLEASGTNFTYVEIADKLNPVKDIISVARISRILKKLQPDILHIHGNKSALVGRWAARLAKVNRVIVTVHNFLTYQQKRGLLSELAFFEERRLAKSTSIIAAVSNQVKTNLVNKEGIDENKIAVVNNGFNVENFEIIKNGTRKRYGISDGDFIALNIARMVEFKGQRYLIEACQKILNEIPNFKLMILGSGPLETRLKKYAKKLGVEKCVIFISHVDDTNKLYSEADCFVLPSINEPFGIVLLEAMAHKLPIVAAKSGGVIDVLDEQSAVLVEPKSSVQIAKAVISLAKEKKISKRISSNAHDILQEQFTLNKMVNKTEKIYHQLMMSS
ncbi:hypothetical protein LCGC14_2133100 [marine sediment metagenome]|uniref:Glycosyltransferase subfamily 4-like N-terminal domain-containing protein n=1 Tax=marine sediment metagenome TaxID=412755 RepID=A0A0F9GWT8_9ZZZZ